MTTLTSELVRMLHSTARVIAPLQEAVELQITLGFDGPTGLPRVSVAVINSGQPAVQQRRTVDLIVAAAGLPVPSEEEHRSSLNRGSRFYRSRGQAKSALVRDQMWTVTAVFPASDDTREVSGR